ncbi:sorcin-like [Ciona intestinalis]
MTDPLFAYFTAVAGADGQASNVEIQRCLKNYDGSNFSLGTCTRMLKMLDRDYNGLMGYNEFKEMWSAISQWKTSFRKFDKDNTGTIGEAEIIAAWKEWNYDLPDHFAKIVLWRYDPFFGNRMNLDDFVGFGITLKQLFGQHMRRRRNYAGKAYFSYDEFMLISMCLI